MPRRDFEGLVADHTRLTGKPTDVREVRQKKLAPSNLNSVLTNQMIALRAPSP